MDTIALSLSARDPQSSAKVLRRESIVPCVLYGNAIENTILQGVHNEIYKAYVHAGESTVVELDIGKGKPVPVLFHAIDFHPVSEKIMHVDFYAVDMNKEIETVVPIHFVGEAPAVKDLGGSFLSSIDSVSVRCLPANLPHAIEIDISGLTEFGMSLTAADLPNMNNVEFLIEEDQTLAHVEEPRRAEPETTDETASGASAEEAAEGGDSEASEESAE